ncbi:hypothetical protein EON63_03720 [archaeon]|nr:MAG: hypothetical protein EON63_03720 [archaeon]
MGSAVIAFKISDREAQHKKYIDKVQLSLKNALSNAKVETVKLVQEVIMKTWSFSNGAFQSICIVFNDTHKWNVAFSNSTDSEYLQSGMLTILRGSIFSNGFAEGVSVRVGYDGVRRGVSHLELISVKELIELDNKRK